MNLIMCKYSGLTPLVAWIRFYLGKKEPLTMKA